MAAKASRHIEWSIWLDRWERMQERYVPLRAERFALMARIIEKTQCRGCHILDLGCGPGSLMDALLEALPGSSAEGVDMDPTLLPLAEWRLARRGGRAQVLHADLRDASWASQTGPADAVVSATALHWLTPARLDELYGEVARILVPGGVFLNADHVGSDDSRLQAVWDDDKEEHVDAFRSRSDDWDGFWTAYLRELGQECRQSREEALGPWEGSDSGLPLAWHLAALQAHGLVATDCFWRHGGDAIYGGFMPGQAGERCGASSDAQMEATG